jgi:hypothetical protein
VTGGSVVATPPPLIDRVFYAIWLRKLCVQSTVPQQKTGDQCRLLRLIGRTMTTLELRSGISPSLMGDIHRGGWGGKWRTLKSDLRQHLCGLRGESFPASASRRGTMSQPGRHRRYCWPSIDSLRSLPRTILEHARLTIMLLINEFLFEFEWISHGRNRTKSSLSSPSMNINMALSMPKFFTSCEILL